MLLKKRECETIADLLWNYTQGRLPEESAVQVESHLSRCAACRVEREEYRQTASLVADYRQQSVPESQTDWRALRSRLETLSAPVETQKMTAGGRIGTFAWGGMALAAACVLLAMFGRLSLTTPEAPPTEPKQYVQTGDISSKVLLSDVGKTSITAEAEKATVKTSMAKVCPELKRQRRPRRSTPRRLLAQRGPLHPRRKTGDVRLAKTPPAPLPRQEEKAPPVVLASVDGDRPTLQDPPRNYVLATATPSEEPETARQYVMDNLIFPSQFLRTASAQSEARELQAW